MITGIIWSVGINLYLWIGHPEIYWMWWSLIGCVIAYSTAYLFVQQNFKKRKGLGMGLPRT